MKAYQRNRAEPNGEVRHRFIIALTALSAASIRSCALPIPPGRRDCGSPGCAACIAKRALDRIDRRTIADARRVHHEYRNCPRHPDPLGGVGTVARRPA